MIPRIIHRLWIGGPEPEWTRPFAETWKQPGWTLWQWDDERVATLFPLENQAAYDDAPNFVPNNVGQFRSDLLRFEILYRFGGVYVDADFECLKPIDPLLEGVDCFAAWEVQNQWVNTAISGGTPGHPFFRALIDGVPETVRRNRGSKPNRITGPRYVNSVLRNLGQLIYIFPEHYFYPYGYRDVARHSLNGDYPEAYACHHWANRRREQDVPIA